MIAHDPSTFFAAEDERRTPKWLHDFGAKSAAAGYATSLADALKVCRVCGKRKSRDQMRPGALVCQSCFNADRRARRRTR